MMRFPPEGTPLDDFEVKILAIFDKFPFESAHSVAVRLPIADQIVLWHLHDSIGFKSFHLHWVPPLLTDNLREKRKGHARAMLPFLHGAERDG
jgi:hypothetical protein